MSIFYDLATFDGGISVDNPDEFSAYLTVGEHVDSDGEVSIYCTDEDGTASGYLDLDQIERLHEQLGKILEDSAEKFDGGDVPEPTAPEAAVALAFSTGYIAGQIAAGCSVIDAIRKAVS